MSTLKVTNIAGLSGSSTDVMAGLAKTWVNFNGTGTPAARDSFNFASITDNGTGDQTVNFSNSLSNGNYMWSGSTGTSSAQSNWLSTPASQDPTSMMQTGSVRVKNSYANNTTNSDLQYVGIQVTGDLA